MNVKELKIRLEMLPEDFEIKIAILYEEKHEYLKYYMGIFGIDFNNKELILTSNINYNV